MGARAARLLVALSTIGALAHHVSAQQKREYLFLGEDQTFIVSPRPSAAIEVRPERPPPLPPHPQHTHTHTKANGAHAFAEHSNMHRIPAPKVAPSNSASASRPHHHPSRVENAARSRLAGPERRDAGRRQALGRGWRRRHC